MTVHRKLGRPPNKLRAAARAAGRMTFVPATACKRCKTRLRYTCSSGCVQCGIERGCARYEAIKDDPKALLHYNRHHHA